MILLGSKAHAQTGQVSIGEGEEDHEDDVPGVMGEQNWEVVAWSDVTQHEEWDEDDPHGHKHGQQDAVFTGLNMKRTVKSDVDRRGRLMILQDLPLSLTIEFNHSLVNGNGYSWCYKPHEDGRVVQVSLGSNPA